MPLPARLRALDRRVFGNPGPARAASTRGRFAARLARTLPFAVPVIGAVLLGVWAVFVHAILILLIVWLLGVGLVAWTGRRRARD